MFRKIQRDFRAGVSEPDHEHTLRAETFAVPVLGAVKHGTREIIEPRP